MIKEDVKEIMNKIMTVKEKLQKSIWKEDIDEGYLTHKVGEYLSCFGSIEKKKLEDLLEKDLEHWKE